MRTFTTPEPYQIKRWLIIGAVIMASAAVIGLVINAFILRAVKIEPAATESTHVLQPVTFTYNRNLNEKTKDQFKIEPKVNGTVTISGKTLRFEPTDNLVSGTTYTISVVPIGPAGDRGITTKHIFTPTYVAKQEFPQNLAASLPFGNAQYSITYTVNPENTLNVHVILNAPIGDPRLRQYKNAALEYIKSHNNGTLDKLNVLIYPDPDIEGVDQSHEHEHTDGELDGERGGIE